MNKNNTLYLLSATIATICLLISRHYSGRFENFFHSYGAGLTVPFGLYFLFKIFLPPQSNKFRCALYVVLLTFVSEIAQALGWYAGIFDPKDFIAYIAGTCLALFIDILFHKKSH